MEKLSAEKLISQEMRDNWYFYVNGISLLNELMVTKLQNRLVLFLYQMKQVYIK